MNRYLPHVALATFAVLGLPAVAAWAAESWLGLPAVAGIVLAVGLSLGLASLGARLWMRHSGSRDLVFGDLMVWGWLRRVRSERRLAEATRLLGTGELSAGERAEVLTQLAGSLEARDLYTHGHSRRVTRHAEMIARGMGLRGDEVAKVRTAAAVHDVGKVFTPRDVLMKPGRLTEVEFEVIKRHAADGANMVAELGDRDVTAMVRQHHERLDGSGYPDGERGDEIPLGARIIAVADTFDAMTSSRPYRSACSHKRAMEVLAAEAGTKLDARTVAAFRAYYSRPWPIAGWSLLVTVPQRLASWAGGALQGGAASLSAAALIGGGSLVGPGAGDVDRPQASAFRPAATGELAPRRTQPARPRAATARTGRPVPAARRRLAVGTRPGGRDAPRFQPRPDGDVLGSPPAPAPSPSPQRPDRPARPDRPDDRPPTITPPVLPGVRVPPVDTPRVHTPPVDVPPVHIPSLEAPRIRVPEVRLPDVRLP